MIGIQEILKTPIAEMTPVGDGVFAGESKDPASKVHFRVKLSSSGRVLLQSVVSYPENLTEIKGGAA